MALAPVADPAAVDWDLGSHAARQVQGAQPRLGVAAARRHGGGAALALCASLVVPSGAARAHSRDWAWRRRDGDGTATA